MIVRENALRTLVALVAVTASMGLAWAAVPAAHASPFTSAPSALCSDPAHQYDPCMSSKTSGYWGAIDWVAWVDLRNEVTTGRDIYGRPLAGAESAICTAAGDQVWPTVSVDVFWEDQRDGVNLCQIWGSQIPGVPAVVVNPALSAAKPQTSANTLVWSQEVGGTPADPDYDIFAMYLPTAQVLKLDDDAGEQIMPTVSALYGEWPMVTYLAEDAEGDLGIRACPLIIGGAGISVGTPFWVAQDSGGMRDTSGRTMVYSKTTPGTSTGSDVWCHDLTARRGWPLCRAKGSQSDPAVSGDFVVWGDARAEASAGWEIYACNLRSNYTFKLVGAPGDQYDPDISGDWVVWTDFRASTGGTSADIWGATLDTTCPTVQAPRAASVRRGGYVRLAYRVDDATAVKARVTIKIEKLDGKSVKSVAVGWKKTNVTATKKWKCTLPRGKYRFWVYAIDEAGNPQVMPAGNSLRVR